MGWDLIAKGDTGTRQHIITKLGSETGLIMVKALADLMDDGQIEETAVSIFIQSTLSKNLRPCSEPALGNFA